MGGGGGLEDAVRSSNAQRGGPTWFQAYLGNLEAKAGKTPEELIAIEKPKRYDADTSEGVIVDWLREDYSIGGGHAVALVHVIKHGPEISDEHVGSSGTHPDGSTTLRLDGVANR